MKKMVFILGLALLMGCSENTSNLFYRVSLDDWESILIREATDPRVDINETYFGFDSYTNYIDKDGFVYYPVKEPQSIEGLGFRNTTYPFDLGSNWKYVIRSSDLKKFKLVNKGELR